MFVVPTYRGGFPANWFLPESALGAEHCGPLPRDPKAAPGRSRPTGHSCHSLVSCDIAVRVAGTVLTPTGEPNPLCPAADRWWLTPGRAERLCPERVSASDMQIGVNLWVWGAPITTEHIEETVPRAAEMGFDAVEIPLANPGRFDHDRAAALLEDYDMDVTVVAAINEERDLLHDDPTVRANGREYIRSCVETADAVGATKLGGPMYAAVGRTWQMTDEERAAAEAQLVDQLAELSAHAADHGVTLCVEPLNRFETSFLNTVEQAIAIVDRVEDPHCQLLLDTFHMNVEEKSIPAAIRSAGDRIGYFHACGNDRGAPGNGHLDWAGVTDALADVDYDDEAVIESFTPEVESIAKATAIWRPLESSQDRLARDGLENLREYR